MMKKGFCLLLALCCALLMTGCTGKVIEEDNSPVPTLHPAEARYTAPDGDGIISEGREYRMYFPARWFSVWMQNTNSLRGRTCPSAYCSAMPQTVSPARTVCCV